MLCRMSNEFARCIGTYNLVKEKPAIVLRSAGKYKLVHNLRDYVKYVFRGLKCKLSTSQPLKAG